MTFRSMRRDVQKLLRDVPRCPGGAAKEAVCYDSRQMTAFFVFAFFLYFPYGWCALRGESPEKYALLWRLSPSSARELLFVTVGALVPLTIVSLLFFTRFLPPWHAERILPGILSGLAAAVAEETFFRGWLQTLFAKKFSEWRSILLASFFFGLAHIFQSPAAMLAFFPGIIMGLLRSRHGTVFPAILFHWFGNIWSIWFYPHL